MSEIKLCKDCKYYSNNWVLAVCDCKHPSLYKKSLVTGEMIPSGGDWSTVCFVVRASDETCGPDGDLHEPREKPWWRFW